MNRTQTIASASVIALVSLFVAGCEQADIRTEAAAATPLDAIAPEGAIDCPIVCVSEVVKDAHANAGRVAIRGVVSKVFADRRAFTVANIVEGATCCAGGCGHDSIPARVPIDLYAGDLPEEFERIIMVGEVVPDGEGYEFVIEEVWANGKVVIRKQA